MPWMKKNLHTHRDYICNHTPLGQKAKLLVLTLMTVAVEFER